MSLFRIFDIAGSAMNAESLRLNVVAGNLANAQSVARDENSVYRARQAVFSTVLEDEVGAVAGSVEISDVVASDAPARKEYQPGHPLADGDGYIYLSNVNSIEEMTNMMSATRSYQTNVETINSVKELMLRTLSLGQ